MMYKDEIVYFEKEGNCNFPDVINAVSDYIEKNNLIKNVVVFAGRTNSALKLKQNLSDYNVDITVVTYAVGRKFIKKENGNEEFIIPQIATQESKNIILQAGMNYIQGGLPFEPILSCTGDNATEMIISSLGIISKGLVQCISAAIMAFENGHIEENEKIIALSGDTAILVTPTIKRDLFSGNFRIHKIICKPL